MEVFSLHTCVDNIKVPPLQQQKALEEKCNQLNNSSGNLPPICVRYAERWLRGGEAYYDKQTWEYRALYDYLKLAEHKTGVLFLATLPGTAIAVLPPRIGWMACDLAQPGSGTAGSGFTVLKEEQRVARKPDGQSCIFQPQGSNDYDDKYLFALLNIVGQDYSTLIIDATCNHEYAFHLQVALNKMTIAASGCFFIWRVDTAFLLEPENQDRVSTLIQEFDSVEIATLKSHDRFDTHFIIASKRRAAKREPSPDLSLLITRLVDHWLFNWRMDYIRQMSLAKYFESENIQTTNNADIHWNTHAHEYYKHLKHVTHDVVTS